MWRFISILMLVCSWEASADRSDFVAGPVFTEYGKHAAVPGVEMESSTRLKVAFDAVSAAEPGKVNQQFDSVARFINMHVANGIPKDNIQVALVVHGGASLDLLKPQAYKQKQQGVNANIQLVKALLEHNVTVIMCGQSFMGHGLSRDMLIDGVALSLSAMTAHALLQQHGYTLNPF
ncbi:DsrE family protein [Alteromonas sp. ASW11-19]|uniref:DsrE family protein n=1 Tax=Alteromonas salexigens TaxID=2982530 RepID=A0ABT2VNF4_9ALTE|nr:DsrE family protein [Alteromonas salexigens]MCU7554640.1 DsrE family protein [Alteromonas salexigens]